MALNFLDDLAEIPEVIDIRRDERVDPERISAWIVKFQFEEAVVTIRFELGINPYLTITNMTVLPDSKQRNGYGKKAMNHLLKKAVRFNLFVVHATQVQNHVAGFWEKCGFKALNTVTADYKLSIEAYEMFKAEVDRETAAGHIY